MKVSVIIPSYKPADYIYQCLDSLLNQEIDKKHFELIIVLNGCNEPYKSELDRYLESNVVGFNYTLCQVDEKGVSNARNIGLNQAKGAFICFIDDDDYVSPSYLSELLKYATPDIVALSNTIAFNDNTKKEDHNYRISKSFIENKEVSINQAKKFFSGPGMKLIHRDIIGKRRFDTRFKVGEDSLFMFLISDQILKCKFTSKNCVYYRRYRENSAITSKKSFKEVTINQSRLIFKYTKVYFTNMTRYNFVFYITRILGAKRSWLHQLKSKG